MRRQLIKCDTSFTIGVDTVVEIWFFKTNAWFKNVKFAEDSISETLCTKILKMDFAYE